MAVMLKSRKGFFMKTDYIEKTTFSEVLCFLKNKPDKDIF